MIKFKFILFNTIKMIISQRFFQIMNLIIQSRIFSFGSRFGEFRIAFEQVEGAKACCSSNSSTSCTFYVPLLHRHLLHLLYLLVPFLRPPKLRWRVLIWIRRADRLEKLTPRILAYLSTYIVIELTHIQLFTEESSYDELASILALYLLKIDMPFL